MKSRRRIAFPQAQNYGRNIITAGICDLRNGVQRSFCAAAIQRTERWLWVNRVILGAPADVGFAPHSDRKSDIHAERDLVVHRWECDR